MEFRAKRQQCDLSPETNAPRGYLIHRHLLCHLVTQHHRPGAYICDAIALVCRVSRSRVSEIVFPVTCLILPFFVSCQLQKSAYSRLLSALARKLSSLWLRALSADHRELDVIGVKSLSAFSSDRDCGAMVVESSWQLEW